MRRVVKVLATMAVVAGVTVTPASASAASCVSGAEASKVEHGDTRRFVKRVFDMPGRVVDAQGPSYALDIWVRYRSCGGQRHLIGHFINYYSPHDFHWRLWTKKWQGDGGGVPVWKALRAD